MIYTYYETENIDYWLSRSGLEHHRDKDYAVWMSRPPKQRVSLVEIVTATDESIQLTVSLKNHSALCMIFVPELIEDTWLNEFDSPNVILFLAGILNVSHDDLSHYTHTQHTKDTHWQQILAHPLFADFYQNICDPSWPSLDILKTMKVPPETVRQEILMSFQEPEEPDQELRYNQIHDVLQSLARLQGMQWATCDRHFYFFWSTCDLYRSQPQILEQLNHNQDCKGFDILLGRRKKHRDLIYEAVDRQVNVVTYFDQIDHGDIAHCKNFIWPESVLDRPGHVVLDTTDEVLVNGVIASLSQVIPIEVYNGTAFSLVCESQCDNAFSFFTEKIIKPMLARRIFVVFSGQYYLRNLRGLGFRTFDGIIDENYDNLLRMEDRGQAVLKLVNGLQNQDPRPLYHQAQPILDHNFNLVMNTDWQQLMCDAIKNRVENFFINK